MQKKFHKKRNCLVHFKLKALTWHFGRKQKQVEVKKYEFEKQSMSKLFAFSGVSSPSEFHCSEKKQ